MDIIITLLVGLIVIALLYWAVMRILGAFGIPDQLVAVVQVIFVVIMVMWLLSVFGGAVGHLRLPR